MFDGKIRIYIKFWVRKDYSILGGIVLPPFVAIMPSNFDLCWPKPPRSGRHISVRCFFSKKLNYVCSSALNDQFSGEKVHFILIMTMSYITKTPKNAVFAQLGLFWQNCWGTAVFETSCTFSPGTLLSNTILHSYVSFLKKRPIGRYICRGVSTGLFGKNQ